MKTYNQFCEFNKAAFYGLTEQEKRYRYTYFLQGFYEGWQFQNTGKNPAAKKKLQEVIEQSTKNNE